MSIRRRFRFRVPSLFLSALVLACGADVTDDPGRGIPGDGGVDGSSNNGGTSTGGTSSGGSSVGGSSAGGTASGGVGSAGSGTEPASNCITSSECAIRSISCCGSCGAPTRDDVIAMRRDALSDYTPADCGMGCPACAMLGDSTLLASCDDGICTVLDLQLHRSPECMSNTDCAVRTQACCPCGSGTGMGELVAISDSAAYEVLVCGGSVDCDDCVPEYPLQVTAACESGRCVLNATRF